MWPEIVRHLPGFSSAVLTGLDAEGYPLSVRCQPRPDANRQALRVDVAPGLEIQPGPACLLCHRHDERLWNLKSFVVQGELARDEAGWVFRPQRFIPGMGIGGWMSYVRFVLNGRRLASAYLKKRGLPRPRVPWDEIDELMTLANDDRQA